MAGGQLWLEWTGDRWAARSPRAHPALARANAHDHSRRLAPRACRMALALEWCEWSAIRLRREGCGRGALFRDVALTAAGRRSSAGPGDTRQTPRTRPRTIRCISACRGDSVRGVEDREPHHL